MANLALVKVGQTLTAKILNGIIGRVNGQALTGIVPTAVSGGTMSVNGQVVFTNSSTVSLDGVFTTDFDNYRITWNSSTRSAAASTQFRLRQASADITTATYDYVKGYDAGTARTVQSSSSSSAVPLDVGVAAGMVSSGVFDLFGPALGVATLGTVQASVLAASALTSVQTSIANESTVANTGFTLFPLSGTWTGTIRVYGYNNLI